MDALVTIDGLKLEGSLEPSTYSGSTSTMVDSGISVSGHLLGAVVRNDAAQISLSWNHLSAVDWAKINKKFKENYINPVEFFDQTENTFTVRNMYVSDRSAGMYQRDSKGDISWSGCSLQLTEV